MKSSRLTCETAADAGPVRSWINFWFTPVNPIGLHVVRMLTGILLLAWLLPLAGDIEGLFGLNGWFDTQAYVEAGKLETTPKPISWSLIFVAGTDTTTLRLVFWGAVLVIGLFTLGVAVRLTSVLTWLIVASFTANPVVEFDADVLFLVLTFYVMVGYVLLGQRRRFQSWTDRLLGSRETWLLGRSSEGAQPSVGANLALRLLQIHVALVVLTSAVHKLQLGHWWAGYAFWYPLYPPFETTLAQARTYAGDLANPYMFILSAAAYAALAWQIGFPLFAWRPRWWRSILLGGAFVGILGSALLYRIPLFGQALFIGCLGFITAEEWLALFAWLPNVPGLQWLEGRLPGGEDEHEEFADKPVSSEAFTAAAHR